MNKVSLEIIGLTYSESSTGAYVLILGDKNSQRKLPIVIGGAEAESIAVGIDRKRGGRPLTHDLFLRFAKEFGIEIKEVVINRFREGIIMETSEQDDQPDNQDDPISINKVSPDTNFDLLTVHELENMLEEAIENEDYGLAAKIRDEINGRK